MRSIFVGGAQKDTDIAAIKAKTKPNLRKYKCLNANRWEISYNLHSFISLPPTVKERQPTKRAHSNTVIANYISHILLKR